MGRDGVSVSMVLTSQAHRCCTPRKNRRIPTICAGRFDAGHVHVSAVNTGPRRSESGVLGGTARRLRHKPLRSLPAVCAGARWSGFDAGSALSLASSRSTPRGSGSTDRGLCVLHEGPTYPKYPQPSSSSTPPSCSASRRRRQPPQSSGQPPPTSPSSSSPIRQTHPASVSDVMTSETLRSHETTQ